MLPNGSVVPKSAAARTTTKRNAESAWTTIRTGPSTSLPKLAPRSRPRRVPLELRRLPQRPERDERDDEHERSAPEEEPLGNGEVLDPPDPVGEDVREELRDHYFTVSCASSASIGWSSSSKRPCTLATNWITVGTPFLMFFSML